MISGGPPGRVGHDVGALRDAGRRGVLGAVERRQRLARQRHHRRLVAQLQDVAIGLDDLVGVARPQHDQAGHGAQRQQLLDRLVRRAVLAVAHGVMGEDEDRRQLHQRRQPDRRPGIVAEDEEGRAERPQLGQRHAVDDRRHGMLADAEMEIAAAGAAGLEVAGAGELQRRLVRRAEVGRAAEEPGNVLGQHVQHLARGVAAGDALGIGREARQVAVPARRAARAAASGRSRRRAPGTACGSRRRAPPSAAAPRRRARRCRHRNAA